MIVSKYSDQIPSYTFHPNDLINDLKAVSEIIGGPGPTYTHTQNPSASPIARSTAMNPYASPKSSSQPINPYAPQIGRSQPMNPYAPSRQPINPYAPQPPRSIQTPQTHTQSTSMIANTLSIDLSEAMRLQMQVNKDASKQSKKSKVVEITAIQTLFNPDKEPKPIPIHKLDWRLGALDNKPTLYTADALPELLKVAEPVPFGETKDKVIRILVTKEGELVLGLEGKPGKEIPAHFQMSDLDVSKALCITAGNAYFNDKGELTRIDHKSGDFRPPFDTLQHALALLVKAGVKFAPEVHIDKLNDRGGTEKRFTVKGEDITAHYTVAQKQVKLSSEENIDVTPQLRK